MNDGTQIDKLQIDISVIEQNTTARINQLTQALDGLYNKLSDINNITNKLGKGTGSGERKGNKTTEIFGGETAKGNYSHKGLFNAFKLTATVHIARKLGRTFGYIAQQGADFTETLNLWETAMGKNLNTATTFVDKMNEAYGVSEKTLMNAQATFKNMLGSLGQISDETAYRLSEGVTQMALDYASLYNQTFAQAMTKFQAALAGQVRPIRSVSGFDITENTLFQLYQSLGGTKTMRQLSRTEKQLLSIYAIFQQMEASGTVGDLRKTMESFANQSRVAAESFQEILQYSGVLITHALTQAKVMQYLNGFLIFLADTLKAVAENTGAIQHFGDPFQATTDGALAAGKATDELKGKLLGFDKFNALNTNTDDNIGLDEKLLEALSQYSSVLSTASMEATEIAKALKTASGLFNEDGTFNIENWNKLKDTVESLAIVFGLIVAPKIIAGLAKIAFHIGQMAIVVVPIYSLVESIKAAIKAFKEGEIWIGIVATAIAGLSAALLIYIAISKIEDFWNKQKNTSMLALVLSYYKVRIAATTLAVAGLGLLVGVIGTLISKWDEMSTFERVAGIFSAIGAAALVAAAAVAAFHNSWTLGTASVAIIGGLVAIGGAIAAFQSQLNDVEFKADGGIVSKGSLFIAGEAGAELVTNMGGGQSGVMNMEQLESAVARGMLVGLSSVDLRDDRPIYVNIDGQRFFTASRDIYRRNGYDVTAKR